MGKRAILIPSLKPSEFQPMKNSWAQPSLSRDFAVLSAAILFLLCIISAVVTYSTYTRNSTRIEQELDKESLHIEHVLDTEMENANYLLTALGKQIVLDEHRDLTRMAHILKSFENHDYIYALLSWVNPDHMLVVSSDQGVRDKPVDVSDRDYVQQSIIEPWKMTIGRPIEGRTSGRWIIPVGMGITDSTGKFIGTVMLSIDINTLTKRISSLVQHEGSSFAIVSKELIPIAQASEDKDFVSHNFPSDNLVNLNFSKAPTGLVARGNLFWDTGNYTYYRVTSRQPYIILLGYDTHYSNEAVRGLLWSRLLQMVGMALFFMLFLWLVRVRLIKPVLRMTDIAADVAGGKPYHPPSERGPVEIAGLGAQLRRVGEYIEEGKRIENELRHKMFQMKETKLHAEVERRSQAEFMATMCQEMRTPLNNIIGAAQVMKDQLYGPLENRKYRQYAIDTYITGNALLDHTQELQALAKAETGYIELEEKPQDVEDVVNKALRFLTDKMQAQQLSIRLDLQEPLPRLIADAFRLQQILMNLLLYFSTQAKSGSTVQLETRVVSENRERKFFAFIIRNAAKPPLHEGELLAMAEENMPVSPEPDLRLELAKSLVRLHHGRLTLRGTGAATIIAVFLPGNRIRFNEAG